MVQKLIAKVDTQGVKDIFSDELSLDQFKTQLHYYCYASLDGFYNAYQTCLDLFVEAKISEPESDKTLYDKFYKPYFDRFKALESEMKIRDDEISAIALSLPILLFSLILNIKIAAITTTGIVKARGEKEKIVATAKAPKPT